MAPKVNVRRMHVKLLVGQQWFVDHLYKMDWVARHEYIEKMSLSMNPNLRLKFHQAVGSRFPPSELMFGTCTGAAPSPVIALANKPKYKQLKITDFFVASRRARAG
jgi:hypothetical protein